MATADVTVVGLADALGISFDLMTTIDDNMATLTTEHPAASYGQAVLVKDGKAYGPGDLEGVTIHLSATNKNTATLIALARAAGWAVSVAAWCDYCGASLTDPETRSPGDRHETCR